VPIVLPVLVAMLRPPDVSGWRLANRKAASPVPWRRSGAEIRRDRSLFGTRAAAAMPPPVRRFGMRHLALAVLVLAASAQAAPDRTQEVLQIERDWCAAYQRGDVAYLEQLMTPDFTLIGSGGTVNTAASEIEELKSGAVKYSTFENRDMQVRFYGDTAIVIGRTHAAGTSGGKPFDIDVAFTDVLVKLDGRWRAVAGHASRKGA
jgi:uncharacterized protein (TIGR02246 family)